MARGLGAGDFPQGTPLNHFFAWNAARLRPDRRAVIAAEIMRRLDRSGVEDSIAWLGGTEAARGLAASLQAAFGRGETERHAAVFRAFEALAAEIDLDALAALRPSLRPSRLRPGPQRILVIKLSALGDFVQALGPVAALRRHHEGDRISLLTTAPYAEFARQTGYFDEVLIDRRPRLYDLPGWLALRRSLRAGNFDRVYDLQTSDRSSSYARLIWPDRPQWSGIARGCSHPHADLDRDAGHTIDKQAEQLLMAGIHPVPLPGLSGFAAALPTELEGEDFVLLIPGSSPRHPAKRWPAEYYGRLAARLDAMGYLPVVLGAPGERDLAATIVAACPDALDLTGKTDLAALAALARAASFTIGNDTGVTHIAAAGGHPVVVLFSNASEPARCAPRGGSVTVLSRPDLADLSVEIVLDAALAASGDREPALALR